MSRILPEALYAALLDNTLHFRNSERNIEANWHAFWAETFYHIRNPTTHSIKGLTLHPQYPLVQWAVTRELSVRLRLPLVPVDAPDAVDTAPSKRVAKPPGITQGISVPADLYVKGHKGALLTTGAPSLIQRLRSSRQPASQAQPSSATLDPSPVASNPIPRSQPSTPGTSMTAPSPGAGVSPFSSPIINKTLHARQGLDSSFSVDFVLCRIHHRIPDSETHIIYGHTSQQRNVHAPMVLELKSTPSRSRFGSAMDEAFHHALSIELRKAYDDIHLKAPVIFQTHPHQQSIIALAAAGYWWSFSLIRKYDKVVEWSKAYTCGTKDHDTLLRTLYAAAEDYPDNPAEANNGWISQYIQKHRRTDYSSTDCMVKVMLTS